MKKLEKLSPEFRERAVRMVQEHNGEYPSLWAAIEWCRERMAKGEVEPSAGSEGDSCDNALEGGGIGRAGCDEMDVLVQQPQASRPYRLYPASRD